uniref:Uncharacterized protein n=1 Tax=Oryza meridionalis TaxID=40149 RepID=A0A0E0EAB8_9ORYZ
MGISFVGRFQPEKRVASPSRRAEVQERWGPATEFVEEEEIGSGHRWLWIRRGESSSTQLGFEARRGEILRGGGEGGHGSAASRNVQQVKWRFSDEERGIRNLTEAELRERLHWERERGAEAEGAWERSGDQRGEMVEVELEAMVTLAGKEGAAMGAFWRSWRRWLAWGQRQGMETGGRERRWRDALNVHDRDICRSTARILHSATPRIERELKYKLSNGVNWDRKVSEISEKTYLISFPSKEARRELTKFDGFDLGPTIKAKVEETNRPSQCIAIWCTGDREIVKEQLFPMEGTLQPFGEPKCLGISMAPPLLVPVKEIDVIKGDKLIKKVNPDYTHPMDNQGSIGPWLSDDNHDV